MNLALCKIQLRILITMVLFEIRFRLERWEAMKLGSLKLTQECKFRALLRISGTEVGRGNILNDQRDNRISMQDFFKDKTSRISLEKKVIRLLFLSSRLKKISFCVLFIIPPCIFIDNYLENGTPQLNAL